MYASDNHTCMELLLFFMVLYDAKVDAAADNVARNADDEEEQKEEI